VGVFFFLFSHVFPELYVGRVFKSRILDNA
jgi:hypothetical protein